MMAKKRRKYDAMGMGMEEAEKGSSRKGATRQSSKKWMTAPFSVMDHKERYTAAKDRWLAENANDHFYERIEQVTSIWNLGETELPNEKDLSKNCILFNEYAVGRIFLLGLESTNGGVKVKGWKDKGGRWGNEHYFMAKCIGLKNTPAHKGHCFFWCPKENSKDDKSTTLHKHQKTLKQFSSSPFV